MARKTGPKEQSSIQPGARSSERSTNKATVRILHILGLIADQRHSVGVTEISNRLKISKNMAFRALTTLVEEGYLVRDPGGLKYDLGFRAFEFQNPHFSEADLVSLCSPFIERAQQLTQQAVFLVAPVGQCVVVLHELEGTGAFARRIPIGTTLPLHASAGSRAVLAFMPDAAIGEYLEASGPLVSVTRSTITDPTELRAEILRVRECGYALGIGDYVEGVASVAFPILGTEGRPHGAWVVGGPESAFPESRLRELLPQLRVIAADLNELSSLYYVRQNLPSLI